MIDGAKFLIHISVPTWELGVHEIWPDGDAPEVPTAADVVEQMRRDGSALGAAQEWNLLDEVTIWVTCLGKPTDHAEYK